MKVLVLTLFCMPILLWAGIRSYYDITFGIDCGGHIERAGSANSIDLARQEMEVVVKYAENHGVMSGYTSVLYNTPDEDLGFWFNNMKASLEELGRVKPTTSELEKSNLLIKLRESLMHHGNKSTDLTIPEGITVFPHNTAFAAFGYISLFIAMVGGLITRRY